MFYEATREGLAKYLADLKLKCSVSYVTPSEGYRYNQKNQGKYEIAINSFRGIDFIPRIDTILSNSELTVKVTVPTINYVIRTNEISRFYRPGETLGFKAVLYGFSYSYTADTNNVSDYASFVREYNTLMTTIENKVTSSLCHELKPAIDEDWHITVSCLDIEMAFEELA